MAFGRDQVYQRSVLVLLKGRPMEIKWLEDFLTVASTGSFSKAAEQRNVTQPAFSRRIKSLELWLGTDLIDRSTYPTKLTKNGLAFRETAEEAVAMGIVPKVTIAKARTLARIASLIEAGHSIKRLSYE